MERTPDQLLAEISDELGRRIAAAAGSLRSASPGLNVMTGFPFTLIRIEPQSTDARSSEEALRPFPVIYEIGSDDNEQYILFYLGNPTTANGDYPVRLTVTPTGKQFYFLKLTATVDSICTCLDVGPPANWVCVDRDVSTDSVEVVCLTELPEQVNPINSPPCGEEVEGSGWGDFYGTPSGTYTIYLPLLCLDFTSGSLLVTHASDELDQILTDNPMTSWLRDVAFLSGDCCRLWWSNGGPYSGADGIFGGDPGAVYVHGIATDPLDPEDSEFILRSL